MTMRSATPEQRALFPGIRDAGRNERRQIGAIEAKERASGKWGPFQTMAIPPGTVSGGDPDGWMVDVHTVYRNDWCVVMVRTCKTAIGYVQHAMIRTTRSAHDLTWGEKQRIKDECFGALCTGVEVFPASDRMVDAANLYHLWILPLGYEMPFGLHDKDAASRRHYRP